jgi:hypothetical protein
MLRTVQIVGGAIAVLAVATVWIDPRADTIFNTVRLAALIIAGFPAGVAALLLHLDKRTQF